MNTEQIRSAKRVANALKHNMTEAERRWLTGVLNYVSEERLEQDINDLWELLERAEYTEESD